MMNSLSMLHDLSIKMNEVISISENAVGEGTLTYLLIMKLQSVSDGMDSPENFPQTQNNKCNTVYMRP